jgi:dTMP kinase
MDERFEKFKGKLIVFEGPQDHCGKSTLAKALYDKLVLEGVDAILTKQPGGDWGPLSETFRSYAIDKKYNFNPIANLFLFLTDRSQHTSEVVIPAIRAGKTVICDRWYYSTIAYQFYGKQLLEKYQLNKQFAYWMNRVASMNQEPDAVFFIERDQVNVEKTPDDQWDQFETASYEFKLRVRKAYYDMAKENDFNRIQVVEGDVDATLEKILNSSL